MIGPTAAQAAKRRERFVRWRQIQACGGFILACCFFLPAVDSCNSPVIPAEEVFEEFESGIDSFSDLCMIICVFVAAYLFGLLVCILGAWPVSADRSEPRGIGLMIALLLAFVVFTLFAMVLGTCMTEPDLIIRSVGFALFSVAVMFSLVYLRRAVRLGASSLLHLRWYAALCCLAWFMLWLPGKTFYGLWLSIFGSVLILVGATGEATVRAKTTWRPALRLLLTSRIKLYEDDLPRCENCGYILIGLTEKRCPECGQPFEVQGPDASAPNGAAGCTQG